jgi:hypothetical protein
MRSLLHVTFILLACLLVAPAAFAQRADDADRASKNGRTTATIDSVDIVVEYGRPNVNGREVWGKLVPYDEVWRTGANEATTISFSSDVAVEGDALPAGTYSLFTVPGADEWTVIFNKVAEQWGAFGYDPDQDALRVTVTPVEIEHVESMDFVAGDSTITFRWAELGVPFVITTD